MQLPKGPDLAGPSFQTRRRGRNFALLSGLAVALAATSPTTAEAAGQIELEFADAVFNDPLTIDNPLHPLVPGMIYTYRAEGDDGCEWSIINVTGDTRMVAGVEARVVHEEAYEDEDCGGPAEDEKIERTNDWYAQDDADHVWYLGELSEDWNEESGEWEVSDGSWEAGVDGAVAGIIMLANPMPGDQYFQEFYEGFAEDQAKVLRNDVWLSLYYENEVDNDYHECIVTKEWTTLAHGEVENKFYCPDSGLVVVKELKGKTLRFELVSVSGP